MSLNQFPLMRASISLLVETKLSQDIKPLDPKRDTRFEQRGGPFGANCNQEGYIMVLFQSLQQDKRAAEAEVHRLRGEKANWR